MAKLFCVLTLMTAFASAQSVEGNVVNSATGKGIAGVQVRIVAASMEKTYSATTDTNGRFLIEDLKAGTYAFGYQLPDYSPSGPTFPQVFQVAAGSMVKLEGRMMPVPKLSGRVVDGRGNAVANAKLTLAGSGRPTATTDAKGTFELRLSPGTYLLSVVPPPALQRPDPEPDSNGVRVWTRTFYPGVAFLEAASKIVAMPGSDLSGIEIKLLAVTDHVVRGVLLNPDGTPAPKVAISLSEDAHGEPAHRTESGSDGAFEFPAVVDGEWRLAAELESHGMKLRITQWIEIAGHDLEGMKFRLAEPFTVRGHVVLETLKSTAAPSHFPVFFVPNGGRIRGNTGMLNWTLWPELHFDSPTLPGVPNKGAEMTRALVLDEQGAIRAEPDADGNFVLEKVYPGSYRVIAPPPPPYYLATLRMGGNDMREVDVELSSGVPVVTVVFKTNGGSVRGTVENCASGLALLVPQDLSFQSLGFLRSLRCDSRDRYEITAVRPGDYYALAFIGKGPVPPLDDNLFNQASKITVREGESTSTDLHALPRP